MKNFEYRLIAVPSLDRTHPDPVQALAVKVQRVINAAKLDGWTFQQVERLHLADGPEGSQPNVLVFRRLRHRRPSKPTLVLSNPAELDAQVASAALNPVRKPTIEFAVHGARGDFGAHAPVRSVGTAVGSN